MQVLFIQDYLRPGGTEAQTVHHAKAAVTRGHEITLITFRPGGTLADQMIGSGVRWKTLQKPDLHLNGFAPGLRAAVRSLDPERIVLMGREANQRASQLRSWFPEVSLIGTLRTGRPLPSDYQSGLRSCTRVLVNSDFAVRRVRDLGVDRSRISRIYNPLLTVPAALKGASVNPPPRALTVAAFRPGKQHGAYLKAMSDVLIRQPQWRLRLTGSGPLFRRMRHRAIRMLLSQQVEFPGFISDASLRFQDARVFVLPSLEESLPNAVIEAQAWGLPVVAFAVAGVPECVLDGQSGFLLEPGDFAGLAAKTAELLADPELAGSMGMVGQEFVSERFDGEARTAEFLNAVEPA